VETREPPPPTGSPCEEPHPSFALGPPPPRLARIHNVWRRAPTSRASVHSQRSHVDVVVERIARLKEPTQPTGRATRDAIEVSMETEERRSECREAIEHIAQARRCCQVEKLVATKKPVTAD